MRLLERLKTWWHADEAGWWEQSRIRIDGPEGVLKAEHVDINCTGTASLTEEGFRHLVRQAAARRTERCEGFRHFVAARKQENSMPTFLSEEEIVTVSPEEVAVEEHVLLACPECGLIEFKVVQQHLGDGVYVPVAYLCACGAQVEYKKTN